MPSPFPGMDPYFEGDLWTTFHVQIGVEIARDLIPRVAPRYIARAEKRYLLEAPEGLEIEIESIIPDVGVRQAKRVALPAQDGVISPAPLEMATVLPLKVPHVWIEVRDRARRRLVTAIEILSPTNKRGKNRRDYLRKRAGYLRSSVHLMEIDLVQRGKRPPMRKALPRRPYFVFLSRAERRPLTEIWPIAFEQPLPTVAVPLLEGDADVPLDLQAIFTRVYDVNRFDLEIDYTQRPEVSLPRAKMPWLDKVRKRAARQALPE